MRKLRTPDRAPKQQQQPMVIEYSSYGRRANAQEGRDGDVKLPWSDGPTKIKSTHKTLEVSSRDKEKESPPHLSQKAAVQATRVRSSPPKKIIEDSKQNEKLPWEGKATPVIKRRVSPEPQKAQPFELKQNHKASPQPLGKANKAEYSNPSPQKHRSSPLGKFKANNKIITYTGGSSEEFYRDDFEEGEEIRISGTNLKPKVLSKPTNQDKQKTRYQEGNANTSTRNPADDFDNQYDNPAMREITIDDDSDSGVEEEELEIWSKTPEPKGKEVVGVEENVNYEEVKKLLTVSGSQQFDGQKESNQAKGSNNFKKNESEQSYKKASGNGSAILERNKQTRISPSRISNRYEDDDNEVQEDVFASNEIPSKMQEGKKKNSYQQEDDEFDVIEEFE